MAKEIYFGYSGIQGLLYVNGRGEHLMTSKDLLYRSSCNLQQGGSLDECLEKAISAVGGQLGKRKVDVVFADFYSTHELQINEYVNTYVKKAKSISFVED